MHTIYFFSHVLIRVDRGLLQSWLNCWVSRSNIWKKFNIFCNLCHYELYTLFQGWNLAQIHKSWADMICLFENVENTQVYCWWHIFVLNAQGSEISMTKHTLTYISQKILKSKISLWTNNSSSTPFFPISYLSAFFFFLKGIRSPVQKLHVPRVVKDGCFPEKRTHIKQMRIGRSDMREEHNRPERDATFNFQVWLHVQILSAVA